MMALFVSHRKGPNRLGRISSCGRPVLSSPFPERRGRAVVSLGLADKGSQVAGQEVSMFVEEKPPLKNDGGPLSCPCMDHACWRGSSTWDPPLMREPYGSPWRPGTGRTGILAQGDEETWFEDAKAPACPGDRGERHHPAMVIRQTLAVAPYEGRRVLTRRAGENNNKERRPQHLSRKTTPSLTKCSPTH
jgi:hypothetical protein